MTYAEAQAEITRLLTPYAGRMAREDAIRGLLGSGPPQDCCPDCGSQDCIIYGDTVTCGELPGAHAAARETYLTDEAEVGDECAAWWKAITREYQAVYHRTVEDLGWQGELTATLGRMYREAADRDDWRIDNLNRLSKWLFDVLRERDEARAALATMTERAQGMREALMSAASELNEGYRVSVGQMARAAAGEPIS